MFSIRNITSDSRRRRQFSYFVKKSKYSSSRHKKIKKSKITQINLGMSSSKPPFHRSVVQVGEVVLYHTIWEWQTDEIDADTETFTSSGNWIPIPTYEFAWTPIGTFCAWQIEWNIIRLLVILRAHNTKIVLGVHSNITIYVKYFIESVWKCYVFSAKPAGIPSSSLAAFRRPRKKLS